MSCLICLFSFAIWISDFVNMLNNIFFSCRSSDYLNLQYTHTTIPITNIIVTITPITTPISSPENEEPLQFYVKYAYLLI